MRPWITVGLGAHSFVTQQTFRNAPLPDVSFTPSDMIASACVELEAAQLDGQDIAKEAIDCRNFTFDTAIVGYVLVVTVTRKAGRTCLHCGRRLSSGAELVSIAIRGERG